MRSTTAVSRPARAAGLVPRLVLGLFLAPLAALAGCSSGTRAAAGLDSVEWINTELAPTAPGAFAGKALVVEFWATWCGPCRSSTPHLVQLANEHADEGLVVLGVHVAKSLERAEVDRFVDQYDIPYAIGLDRSGAFASSHGVSGIPDAFVYDRDGDLVWRGHPMDPAFDSAVAQALR
jgi:thiol-disulfide isomerase/thioredoxin